MSLVSMKYQIVRHDKNKEKIKPCPYAFRVKIGYDTIINILHSKLITT